jgi:ribA/ribD-fused uncharacterized protein
MRVIGNVTAYYSKHDFPSHHFLCNFTVRNVRFSSMEQMMMYSKAMLFKDKKNAQRIMATNNCQAQKMIGREVAPFVQEEWDSKCENIVYIGNKEKYRQNPAILKLLLLTADTILVEATRKDLIWGCGIDEDDDRVADPTNWIGQNKHGKIQMRVREYFQNHPEMVTINKSASFSGDWVFKE